jgi:hypothetical protein
MSLDELLDSLPVKVLHLLPRVGTEDLLDVYFRPQNDLEWIGSVHDNDQWKYRAIQLYRDVTRDETSYRWIAYRYGDVQEV